MSFHVKMVRKDNGETDLHLPPGFRFHPTDEELVIHYLCRKVRCQVLPVPIIAEIDLYKYDPWQLPEKALFGEKEWYFFTLRDRKYPNGSRPNRAAGSGYWKATGADKHIRPVESTRHGGIKKALVFYAGKAPHGYKTNWIMHEYRITDSTNKNKDSLRLDDWVLCRIYNKKNTCEKIIQQSDEAGSPSEETMNSTLSDSRMDDLKFENGPVEDDPFSDLADLGSTQTYSSEYFLNGRRNSGEDIKEEEMPALFMKDAIQGDFPFVDFSQDYFDLTSCRAAKPSLFSGSYQ